MPGYRGKMGCQARRLGIGDLRMVRGLLGWRCFTQGIALPICWPGKRIRTTLLRSYPWNRVNIAAWATLPPQGPRGRPPPPAPLPGPHIKFPSSPNYCPTLRNTTPPLHVTRLRSQNTRKKKTRLISQPGLTHYEHTTTTHAEYGLHYTNNTSHKQLPVP